MEAVLKNLDRLENEYIKFWEDICNIESPSDYKEGVDKAGNFVIEKAKKLGFETEILKQEISGNAICITMNCQSDEKPVSLSGHIDTVHKLGSFGIPAVKKDNEKIYGPGVCDCKGGIVLAVYVMHALKEAGYKKRPIKLLLQSDEEVNSTTSNKETIKYICEKAKDSVAFFNLESNDKENCVCIERKGIARFVFKISGIEAHASNCATKGASAILEAAHKVIEIEKIKNNDGVTCSCGLISGGSAVNTVPKNCELKVDVRYKTLEQYEWVKKRFKEISKTAVIEGTKTEIEQISFRMAMEYCEKNQQLLNTINSACSKYNLPTLKKCPRNGGSDAADVTAFGIPCVDSIGIWGDKIHSVDEFAYLSSLKSSAKRLVAVITEL